MPECELHSQCGQGELCLIQPSPTANAELLFASTCLSASLEPSVEGVACQERELEACVAKPGCFLDSGSRLDLEMRCLEEPTPVACLGPDFVCLQAQIIMENADQEPYLFGAICSPPSFTPIYADVDHPLVSELFEVQPDVWRWPTCDTAAANGGEQAEGTATVEM